MAFDPRRTSLGFKLLNPELFFKANLPFALTGTAVFVGVSIYLFYEHQTVERKRREEEEAHLAKQRRIAERAERRRLKQLQQQEQQDSSLA